MTKKTASKTKSLSKKSVAASEAVAQRLVEDIRLLIDQTRNRVAQTVNSSLVLLNWHIGRRIHTEVLGKERASYGKEIVSTLSRQLVVDYGAGFSRQNLFHMIRFVEAFPDKQIVVALCRELGWSHFKEIIYIKDDLKRDFYAEMCRVERWSVRALRAKIQGRLYERTALSRKPEELIKRELTALREDDRLTPDLVFRDPYFLDFLNLTGAYSEKDLENAILRELEKFLLEFGSDFAFLARQKRISVDEDDFYLDLLFYHRRLRRLVAIELKLDKFMPADTGQMDFYLRWLDKHERQTGEEPPIGLILCAEKSAPRVELLGLEQRGMRVAEYWTELPPRDLLERKLTDAMLLAREHVGQQESGQAEEAPKLKRGRRKG